MQTHYHQEHKPLVEHKDCYGVTLQPGLFVAFNKSGEVKKGIIKEIVKFDFIKSRNGVDPKFWWYLKCEIKIQELGTDDHISTIKNINSIIVI